MTQQIRSDALADDLAALAAVALDCDVSEIDLSIEAPLPAKPTTLKLQILGGDDEQRVRPATKKREDAPKARSERPAPAPREEEEEVSDADLEAEADAAADFMEGLLDALDLPGDLKMEVSPKEIQIEVLEVGNGALIGRRGQTLEAIQELMRASLQREFQRRSRVVLDIEGYRDRRIQKLVERTDEVIAEVLETGESVRLEPMDVYERKKVHHLVADREGVISRSHGREPARRVVIEPA